MELSKTVRNKTVVRSQAKWQFFVSIRASCVFVSLYYCRCLRQVRYNAPSWIGILWQTTVSIDASLALYTYDTNEARRDLLEHRACPFQTNTSVIFLCIERYFIRTRLHCIVLFSLVFVGASRLCIFSFILLLFGLVRTILIMSYLYNHFFFQAVSYLLAPFGTIGVQSSTVLQENTYVDTVRMAYSACATWARE